MQADPENADFHRSLGNALQDQGSVEEAIESYRRALRLQPDVAETWNDLGTAHHALGRHGQAAQCYGQALKLDPRHAVAHSNLGSTLRTLGDIRGALRAYRSELWLRVRGALARPNAVRRNATDAPSLAAEAGRWLARGHTRMAAALAEWALQVDARSSAALSVRAEILRRAEDAEGAIDLLMQACAAAPADGALKLRLAQAYQAAERNDLAERAYREAMALGRREPAAVRGLASSVARCGRLDEALQIVEGIALRERDADTWAALARLRLDLGQRDAARSALDSALRVEPTSAPALAQLARLHVLARDVKSALAACHVALEQAPFHAEAHYWQGRALSLSNLWDDAAEAFRRAQELKPNAEAARWRGLALRAGEKLADSETVLREALQSWPGEDALLSELAMAAVDRGELVRAREILEGMLRASPDHVGALAALGSILTSEGRLEEAEASIRRALAFAPESVAANQNLGILTLKKGNFGEGWPRYEWRRRLDTHAAGFLRFDYPEWTGEPLAAKTLLVYAEQGLGDEIMFASCLPDVLRLGARVVLECDPRLGKLFQRSLPGCAVFPRQRTQANNWTRSLDPQPDFQVPIGSLPKYFRRDRAAFPLHAGYLAPDPAKVAKWRERLHALGPGRWLGLSWRGGLARTGRARRSLELPHLLPLLRDAGARFISLQYGDTAEELARFEGLHGRHLVSPGEPLDDYDDAAALVCALEGVVTVCNSLVHLTGALGRPALVMAPYSPEWRYGMSGEAMPWYPSVKVLRQPPSGEWSPVLAEVRATLAAGWGR